MLGQGAAQRVQSLGHHVPIDQSSKQLHGSSERMQRTSAGAVEQRHPRDRTATFLQADDLLHGLLHGEYDHTQGVAQVGEQSLVDASSQQKDVEAPVLVFDDRVQHVLHHGAVVQAQSGDVDAGRLYATTRRR